MILLENFTISIFSDENIFSENHCQIKTNSGQRAQ